MAEDVEEPAPQGRAGDLVEAVEQEDGASFFEGLLPGLPWDRVFVRETKQLEQVEKPALVVVAQSRVVFEQRYQVSQAQEDRDQRLGMRVQPEVALTPRAAVRAGPSVRVASEPMKGRTRRFLRRSLNLAGTMVSPPKATTKNRQGSVAADSGMDVRIPGTIAAGMPERRVGGGGQLAPPSGKAPSVSSYGLVVNLALTLWGKHYKKDYGERISHPEESRRWHR